MSVRTGTAPYRTEIAVRDHVLLVDEPTRLGGGDTGPTPYELLAAALASCTTITLRMYADRKAWPLEEVLARVEHRRVAAQEGVTSRGSRDHFLIEVELRGALAEAQRARLMEIAARCPVHRTLASGATVEISGS